MLKIFKSQKFIDFKHKAIEKIIDHQDYFDVAMSIGRGISSFATTRSTLSFVETAISTFNSGFKLISGNSSSFFTPVNGWSELTCKYGHQALFDILVSALKSFPCKKMKFAYETNPVFIYKLPNGTVGKTKENLYFRHEEITKDDLLSLLLKEKIKDDSCKIISISENLETSSSGTTTTKFDLEVEEYIGLPSKTGSDLAASLKKYLDQGINRSIILNGMPGVGKTALSYFVVGELGLRTLKFKYSKSYNASVVNTVKLLIDTFKIECILIDDFEYLGVDTANMLSFLEHIHRHCKIVIGITNSLRSFSAAVIRPGRIDLIKTVDCLDDDVIRSVLGDFYPEFSPQVEKWPISYINELAIRMRVNPDTNPTEYITELQKRVNRQIASLGGGKKDEAEASE